jgi:glycopeptide antibiotics resistance protein
MKKLLLKYAPALLVGWTLVIFILCATPGRYIPEADWMAMLSIDKLVHASVFFVLNFFFILLMIRYHQQTGWLVFYTFCCILYGIALEWMQAAHFSERSADVYDMVANSAGALLAAILYQRIRRKFQLNY